MGQAKVSTKGAQALADRYLQACIDTMRKQGTSALPPLRVMAAEAGVSVGTLRRALKRYEHDGTLTAIGGKGVFLRGAVAPVRHPKLTLRCERIAHRLEHDILGGQYANADHLPSTKELLARFHADYRTLRKSLCMLAARGLIERDRPYAILRETERQPAAAATLGFLARGQAFAERFGRDILNRVETVEGWCTAHGTSMVPLFYYYLDGARLKVNGLDAEPLPASLLRPIDLGFLLHTAGLGSVNLPSLLDRLHRTGLPVAVVDPHELIEASMLPRRNQRVRVFIPTSQRDAGRAVGRHLVRAGCRHVVFVSPFHGERWSRERLAGIAEVCESSGCGVTVTAYTVPAPTVAGVGDSRLSQSYVNEARTRMIRGGLDETDPVDRLLANAVRTMLPAFGEYIGEELLRSACHAIFERLPALPSDAALVCANDRVARFHYEYQALHHRTPAADIPVVGFDNRFPSTYYRFSSYSFNEQVLFSSAFSYILHPSAWRDKGPFVRLEGRLVARR
ncbi:MAG: GntR family transcriptional regulator [Chitinivibrionales bacterium]|nr:GntR family transcriptional regulator [Chitinivibrionales bacterium]